MALHLVVRSNNSTAPTQNVSCGRIGRRCVPAPEPEELLFVRVTLTGRSSLRPLFAFDLKAAKRQAEVLLAELSTSEGAKVPDGLVASLTEVGSVTDPGAAQAVWQRLAIVPPPVSIVGTDLLRRRFGGGRPVLEPHEPPRAVCVATMRGVPVTDVLVLRPASCTTSA